MPIATKLTFSEFVDLLLAQLYALEREHGPEAFFSLHAIAKSMRDSVPAKWVFDAGKVLEARRLATCAFTMGGHVDAELTGEGRLWVEERQRQESNVIHEYLKNPGDFLLAPGEGHEAVAGSPGRDASRNIRDERAPAFDLLDQIEAELKSETTLSAPELADLLADVATIQRQLEKREPNITALASLLEPLSHVGSVASAVAHLIELINA